MTDPVFFSTFMYSACKVVGAEAWPAYRDAQMAKQDESEWPGFRTLFELTRVCPLEAYIDASTYIDRARCVAVGHFLASDKDVWVTCDDDIDAPRRVLGDLVAACRATRGAVAVPYLNRDGRSMTFRLVRGPTVWQAVEGGPSVPLRVVDRIGFGLVALHRTYLETLASRVRDFRESDSAATRCPQLFRNDVEAGTFQGEDYYFCKLAEDAGMPMQVLCNAPIAHAGSEALLDADGVIRVRDPDRARKLDASIRGKEEALAALPCVKPPSQGE